MERKFVVLIAKYICGAHGKSTCLLRIPCVFELKCTSILHYNVGQKNSFNIK